MTNNPEKFEAPSFEEMKTPYFIREATLEKTLEKISEIEKSKRKIIVYVGVHPNEGTDSLVRKYANDWAEKYGALVVSQPTEETPPSIWKKRESLATDDGIPPAGVAIYLLDQSWMICAAMQRKKHGTLFSYTILTDSAVGTFTKSL